MTERQIEIHKGLKAIGPEIAQFYLDGLELIESNLGTKSNLLAHTLREIDGGLRDIFEQKQLKKEFQEKLKNEDLEKLFNKFKEDYKNFDYLSEITFDDFKKEKGHISSVLVSFGFSFDHPLTAQYIKVVRWLAKYAHRSGAFNEPRNPNDIINLWNEFETVLSKLIGNYYALAERIDSLLTLDEPSQEILKTLPNLLNTESRVIYFFNGLKSRKWLIHLEREGYFDGSKNPEPVESEENPGFFSMPYWAVLTYLEKIGAKNLESPQNQTTEVLARIIDNIYIFKNEQGQRIENYRTDYSIFKIICTLPEQHLNENHFLFISNALQSRWDGLIGHRFNEFLERLILLGNKDLLKRGIQLLLLHKLHEGTFDKVHSIFRSYEFQRILSDIKVKIIPLLGLDLLNIVLQKIKEVLELDRSAFNNITIPAIEDHEQTSFPEKYDCQLVYLLRDNLEKLDTKDIIDTLKILLNEEHPIFNRIAIHTIRIRYVELHEIFWGLGKIPLSIPMTKHEVYELLHQNSKNFSAEEIQQVINWINTKEYYIPEEFKDDNDRVAKSIAYQKKEWLSSLLPNSSEKVNLLLSEINDIYDAEVDHPGFDSWHSSLSGTVSPLTIDELTQLSVSETIKYYYNFNKQEHNFMGPSIDGLIDMFTLTVRKNPTKYNVDCNQFLEAPCQLLYSWIRGLGESWRDDKNKFECKEILVAVKKILQQEEFWKSHNGNENYCRWFVSSLLSFIEDGISDDSHAFEAELSPIIKEILFIIFEKDTYPVFDYSDLSMTVLNNSKGKIYLALFQFSLRLARLEEKQIERWDNNIKELLTFKIESEEDNPLLFHVIGQFLPNIHYLDEKWLIENFAKIFPIKSLVNWTASMNGYFYFHRRPNKMYLKLFVEGGNLQQALSGGEIKGESLNSLIQQICTAYLYDFENFEIASDIVQLLITTKDENIISSVIYFFWSPRFPFETKVVSRIKPFWIEVYNCARKFENDKIDILILSGTCKWLDSIDNIDKEIFEIVLNSIRYLNQQDRYSVIEGLSKHINNTTEEVGLILIEIFKKEVNYDISRGKLIEMVEILYNKGIKEIADKICLLHGEKGFHFLRELYIKFNT
jgi:hypothetical protein